MRQQSHLKRFAGPAVIALCFGCLLWTLRHTGRDIGSLPRPDAAWLAAALGMFLIHYLMQAIGWHLILKSLGERTSSALSMRMWYSSLIARWMPGRVWYTASRLMLARQNGLRVEAVGVGIVLELAYILVGGLLITVVFAGEMLSSVASGHGGVAAIAGVALFIAAAAAVVLRPSGLTALAKIGAVRKLMRKVAGGEVIQDSMPTMSTGRSIFLVAYYTIFWLYSGVMFGVLAHAFIPMTRAAWLACIPAFPGSWLIGFFSIITPAGLGAREGALWVMLRHAMPQSQAVVLAVSSRLMMVAAELLSVAIAFLVFKGVGVGAAQPVPAADFPEEAPEWHFGEFALSPYAKGILQGLARLRALNEEPQTRPMRICFVASTYPRSESDTAVPWLREDLRRLKERGHDIHVFAPAFKGSESHMVDGIKVHRYRYFFAAKEDLTHDAGAPTKIRRPDYLLITLFYIAAGTIGLYRLQRKEKFDLLHIHWPFPHGLFGIVAQKAHPAPLAMSFHGAELLLARKFKFVNPVLRNFTRKADLVTCNSSYTAAAIRELGTCEPIILPYGSPVPERDVTPPTSPQKTILYVGRLIERKGVEYLLQALPLVQREVNCRLVIVGNGVLLDPLKRQVQEMGLERSVEFRVDIPEEELIRAYEECHVFVLPAIVDSRGDTEGLGVVLIEALSFRRPVVASAVGGIVDVIKHEQTGYLAREKDPGSLAVNLIRALRNPEEATRLAYQGYAHVQRTYNWDRIIDRTEELYNGLNRPAQPVFRGAPAMDPAASGFAYDGDMAGRSGKRNMNATKTALTVGAGIVGVGVLALLGKHAAARLNPSTEISVVTDTVHEGTSDAGVMAEGWVVPNSTVNVTIVPGAQGRIVALNANVGDYVTKGQVLADLDTSDHVDDFTAAEAAADSQRAKLSLVEHPYRPEEIEAKRLQVVSDKAAVGIAASHLSVLKQGARPQQLAQARAAVTAAKAQLQLAAADAAREKQLLDKDLVPKAEYDQAATAQAVAQGHVDETQAALSLLQEGARTEEIHAAQLALQQAKITCREDAAAYHLMLQGSRPEAIRQAAADYMASSSMAHKQALMLSHHQVFAPITGIIVARNVNVGEYATPDAARSVSGQPLANNGRSLFVIADAASAQFSASIDQRFFHNIHVGMPVQVGLEAYPGVNFPGHITQVTPLIQPSSTKAASTSVDLSAPLTFTVRATFNASRFRAVPGQVGLLTLSSKQKNLVVPQSAITAFSVGQGVAYVVHNHTVHAQSVQYDASSDGDLHVTKGLKDGDQVVISDPTKLQDGMHVQIVPATAENYNSKAF